MFPSLLSFWMFQAIAGPHPDPLPHQRERVRAKRAGEGALAASREINGAQKQ
jgi:hypothetical protein